MSRLYPVILVLGLLLMAGGVATTYVALGQDSENQPAEAEKTEEPTPTLEPTLEPVVVEQQPVVEQPPVQPTQVPPPTLVPTEVLPPTVVPTEVIPATVVPTEVILPTIVPTEVLPPTEVPAEPVVIEAAAPEQTEAVLPTEALPVMEQTEVVMPTEVLPVVEQTEVVAPTEAVVELEQTEAVIPTEALPVAEQTGVVVPTADPNVLPTLPPVSGGLSNGAEVPTAGPDNPLEPTLLPTLEAPAESTVEVQPTIDPLASATPGEVIPTAVLPEATEEIISAGSLIRGSASSAFGQGIALILTQPNGTTLETLTDEQGGFTFEGLLPGDYRLNATSPGALPSEAIFTLTEGQQLDLPPVVLAIGDLNQDNQIDMNDVVLLAANYDNPADVAGIDLNGDAWIDISDLAIIGAQFGAVGPLPWS